MVQDGWTVLTRAVSANQISAIEYLLSQGAEVDSLNNVRGALRMFASVHLCDAHLGRVVTADVRLQ